MEDGLLPSSRGHELINRVSVGNIRNRDPLGSAGIVCQLIVYRLFLGKVVEAYAWGGPRDDQIDAGRSELKLLGAGT